MVVDEGTGAGDADNADDAGGVEVGQGARRARIFVLTDDIRPELLEYPGLQIAHEMWLRARDRKGATLPARDDLDIAEFGPCLGNLLLLEAIDGGRDFRYLVYGGAIMRVWGRDMHKRRVSDFPEHIAVVYLDIYRQVVRDRVPYFSRTEAAEGDSAETYDRLMLPLGDDGETVDRLLTAIYPSSFRRPVFEML